VFSCSRKIPCAPLQAVVLFCLFIICLAAKAGGLIPIQDHYFDATLFVAETANTVWPPVGVGSLSEYESVYGQLAGAGTDHGHEAARLFFANDGQTLYVVDPQGTTPGDFADALAASLDLPVNLVALPGAACCVASPGDHAAIMAMLTEHVDASPNRFGLADAPLDSDPDALLAYRSLLSSEHAALYAPWLVLPGAEPGDDATVPASSAVAGVISRIDRQEGIFTTPAGNGAQLTEPPETELERVFSTAEHDVLNPAGINLLRELGSPLAIHVWGARTMSSSVTRRYVAVSRFLRHLQFSMTRSLGWVAESAPGDINPTIVEILLDDYLYDYFLQGAFAGTTQNQSYFVSCSSEPPVLSCIVGVAMILPSEFEIIRLEIPYRDALFASRFEME
jgi:hypothetical protein